MMIMCSGGNRALKSFLWTVFLHSVFTVAEDVKDASPSSILRREKREWQWNTFIVYEEKQPINPPETIGTLKNTLSNPNTQFKLLGDGADNTFTLNNIGQVLVLKKLDRETKSSYTLTAQLVDTKTGEFLDKDTEFTIQVLDINDNSPVFAETYIGSVDERASKGTVVLKVTATDKDDPSTPNGMVSYKLLNGTNFFRIDTTTGEIFTQVDTLDREAQSEYMLLVQASDMPGKEGQSAKTVVTININDINDNEASFTKKSYHFDVKENEPTGFKIGILDIKDLDEKQNKNPIFTVDDSHKDIFEVELNSNNDGVLTLKKELDFETKARYTFNIHLKENVVIPPDNKDSWRSASIDITVKDVDEPPVFTQEVYTFNVTEGQENVLVGSVSAKDTDKTSHRIWYSIQDPNSPVNINSETGQLTLRRALDREAESELRLSVTAEEISPSKLKSDVMVKINVLDINDNDPELANDSNVHICHDDQSGTVLGVIGATDKDENPNKFQFVLIETSSNFSLHDNRDNTANIILNHGDFSSEKSVENFLAIEITDGGTPPRTSTTLLRLRVCECGSNRRRERCNDYSQGTARMSVSAVIAILVCIVFILVIVILFELHKRYQKQTVSLGKPCSEIHEQLVAYDEEGGGEMDTNIYDVSILTSARSDASPPAMYAVVKKPSACKGDMAVMIEVKKDEADHDRDGIPYDTLHIYGYEGSESLAGSLSSLESSSSFGSELDYNFLNDWGPRFRTLAQIYGSEVNASY